MNTSLLPKCIACLTLFLLTLLCAACDRNQPAPTVSPTVTITESETLATITATRMVFTVLTTTLNISKTPQLMLHEPLNIRSGPGTIYATVGYFAKNAETQILGRSADGLWWRVQCPLGIIGDSCWVVAELLFSEAINANAVPVAIAPPTATITPTPSPTPCIRLAPAGWIRHIIQAGDTLSELALQSDVTVGEIAGVNCLETDLLQVNDELLLPSVTYLPNLSTPLPVRTILFVNPVPGTNGEIGSQIATITPTPLQRQGEPISQNEAIALGIVPFLEDGSPNSGVCDTSGEMLRLMVANQCKTDDPSTSITLPLAQRIQICAKGLDEHATVQLEIPDAMHTRKILPYDQNLKVWWWSVLPDSPLGLYSVTASLDDVIALPATFTVTKPFTGTTYLYVMGNSLKTVVTPGEFVHLAVAGLPVEGSLFLYRYDFNNSVYSIYWRLSTKTLNASGDGIISFPLIAKDLFEKDPMTKFVIGDGTSNSYPAGVGGDEDCGAFFLSK